MPETQYIQPAYKLSQIDSSKAPRKISYSQLSMYHTCEKQWELSYIKRLAPYSPSIHTVFGTAFHETLQHFLIILYTKGVKYANWIDLPKYLQERMYDTYKSELEKNNGEHFTNPIEMGEFLQDGINILDWFKKRRSTYFSSQGVELLGIEIDLCIPASEKNDSVYWYGFIDVVIRDVKTNRVKIIDIKTSTKGWNKYQKADKMKAGQLVLYKKFFSKQYNVPIDNIDIEFLIVKRKIQEESMFPQKRIQILRPASGKVTQKKMQSLVDDFISKCFDNDGNKNENRTYQALAGKNAKNCRYCIFKEDFKNCPKENRIRE